MWMIQKLMLSSNWWLLMLLDIGNVDVSRVNGVIGLMLLDAANYYLVLKQVLHGLSLMVSLFMLQSFGLMQHLQLMMSFSSSRSLGYWPVYWLYSYFWCRLSFGGEVLIIIYSIGLIMGGCPLDYNVADAVMLKGIDIGNVNLYCSVVFYVLMLLLLLIV